MRLADAVVRHAWTLRRFGLSPRKLAVRFGNRGEPPILCVSLPKAGTHLLERALCLHPRLYRRVVPTLNPDNIHRWGGLGPLSERLRAGQILISHLHFTPEYPSLLRRAKVRSVFLIRDPRDILVSLAFYVAGDPGHHLHDLFAALPDTHARIRLGITGDASGRLPPLRERLAAFSGWLSASDLVVRYESLIGGTGGGDSETQRATLVALYQAIGAVVTDALVDGVSARLFSRASPTFRKGTTGQWRKHFTPELQALLETEAGAELRQYGYASEPMN